MRLPSSSGSAPASAARSQTGDPAGRTRRPSTPARPAARTLPGSARPPNSSVRPVTTMVFPAPVSPVTTVSPRPSSSVTSSIEPRPRMRSSVSRPGSPASPGPAVAVRSGVVVGAATSCLPRFEDVPVAGDDVPAQHGAAGEQLVPGTGVPRLPESADRQPELGDQPVSEGGGVHPGDPNGAIGPADLDAPAVGDVDH